MQNRKTHSTRFMPAHLAHAIALFIGPIPHYAPNERATACGIGPMQRSGNFNTLQRREQMQRLSTPK